MADVKISQLPASTTPLAGTELVPIVQGGVTKQTTVAGFTTASAGYTPSGTGAVARSVASKLQESVSVKDFGAVGDGVTDDTAAIQAALDYISANGGRLMIEGVCGITSPLTILAGAKWVIDGTGGYNTNSIKALAAMDYMIELGNDAVGYQGDVSIIGLGLIGNSLAGGINTYYTRYATFERLRFIQIPSTKTCLKIGNWANRVSNCILQGGDKSVELVSISTDQLNGIVFDKNVFSDANYGIYQSGADYANGVVVRDNIFDTCVKAAIYWYGTTRGLTITGNYVEACGGTANSVEISSGVFANRYGAFVFAKNYAIVEPYDGLNIYDNNFVTCTQSAPSGSKVIIGIENVDNTHIYDNTVYPGSTYDAFISLDGVGVIFTTGRRVRFEHADKHGIITELVKNNTTTSTGYGNFSAKFNKNLSLLNYEAPNIWDDVASLALSGSMTVAQSYTNGINKIEFNRTAGAQLDFDTSDANLLNFFKNKYFRVNGQSLQAGTNGLRVIVQVDTGSGLSTVVDSSVTAATATRITQGNLFFVPSTTTRLLIRVYPVSTGIINVYNLRLVDTVSEAL